MAKIPLGPGKAPSNFGNEHEPVQLPAKAALPRPLNPLTPASRTSRSVPAIPISAAELAKLGLSEQRDPLPSTPLGSDKVARFVSRVRPAAEQAAAALNVPVEAVIAQWAYESGWGESQLARSHNNLGGIKAYGGWTGKQVTLPTFEKDKSIKVNEPFRAYDSVEDYANDYIKILSKPRYTKALGTNNVTDFGLRLGEAGYHQDSREGYAKALESIAARIRSKLRSTGD